MSDEDFMRRALARGAENLGKTAENPSVGCVVVRDGIVIGEAVTAETGRPHAEEQALTGIDARGATAYVTLEPCAERSHGGPSCSELLIRAGVARVVIAAADPHPKASNAGVARMKAAGIVVETGLLEAEALAQNADFIARWQV